MPQGRTVTSPASDAVHARLAVLEQRVGAVEAELSYRRSSDRPKLVAMAAIGELLRRRRRQLGQTQVTAAGHLGVDQATVSKWERGDQMGVERLAAVAAFLDLSLAEVAHLYAEQFGS